MSSNNTWVCFACNSGFRKDKNLRSLNCQFCGSSCVNLGYKIAIPLKSKPKLWEQLRFDYYLRERQQRADRRDQCLQRIRWYEQEIAKLEARPKSIDREKVILNLKASRADLWRELPLFG